MAETKATPPRHRHLGAGAALSVAVQGGPLFAAAVLSIVLARTIGPSGNGRFALLVTLIGFTFTVCSLSLASGIAYEVSRRRWSVRKAFRETYLAALVLGLVGALGGFFVFLLAHDTVFKGIDTWVAVVALTCVPTSFAYQNAEWILLARERYEDYAGIEVVRSLIFVLLGAGLAFPFGLAGAVVGFSASALVATLVGAWLLHRETRRDTVVDRGGSLMRALRFGLQGWGANLMQQLNYRVDLLILGGFAASREVGLYSVAVTLTAIAWVLPMALGTVLLPRVASLDESALLGEMTTDESDAAVAKSVRHGVLLMLPAGVGISLLLLVAIPVLYGSKFTESIALGFILLPGVLVIGVGKVLGYTVSGRGYPRYALYVAAVTLPLTLGLYFTLIPAFHAWGAAIASTISYVLTTLLMLLSFRRATRIELRRALVPRAEDVADYVGLARLAFRRRVIRRA
jgi:O-antigen/teichoic acid export membrane protein